MKKAEIGKNQSYSLTLTNIVCNAFHVVANVLS